MSIVSSGQITITNLSDGKDGTSGIIVSSVVPDSPQTGQLWQDTSTTPQLVKKWTGSSWVIWKMYVENMVADTISSMSSNLGDVTAGTYTSWFTEINKQNGLNMLNGIYLFNGRIRSLVIQSENTINQDTVLGSGVSTTAHGTEQYGGRIRYFAGAFNLGITPNQLLHDMETYGYWSEYDIAGATGTSSLVSEIIGYNDGINISGDVVVNNVGKVMLSAEALAVNIVPNTPYTIGSLTNFDAIKLYGQLFARRNFTLELDLTGPQLKYPDFTGYTRMVSATTGSRNENVDSREFMVYACINSALNTLLLKVFYRDGGNNWTENTSTTNTIYKVVPIIY